MVTVIDLILLNTWLIDLYAHILESSLFLAQYKR